MDVVLKTSVDWISAGVSAQYEDGNGLAVGSTYEWKGPIVSWSRGAPTAVCGVPSGVVVNPPGFGRTKGIQSFECVIPPANNPPVAPPGTYRVGTIVWDTSGTYVLGANSVTIAAFIDTLVDGFNAVVNGNIIVDYPVTVQSQTLNIQPAVPSMSAAGLAGLGAAVLGIGIVALVVAGHRRLD
jgi:hypothetical protein